MCASTAAACGSLRTASNANRLPLALRLFSFFLGACSTSAPPKMRCALDLLDIVLICLLSLRASRMRSPNIRCIIEAYVCTFA